MASKATETPECPLYFPSHTYCYPASKEKKLHELRFQLLFVGNQLKTTGFTTVVGLFLPQPGGQENSCYITLFPKNTTNFFASFSCSSDSTPTLSDKKRDAYRWLLLFLWSIHSFAWILHPCAECIFPLWNQSSFYV